MKKFFFHGFSIYCFVSYLIILLQWNDRHKIAFLLRIIKSVLNSLFPNASGWTWTYFLAFPWQILLIIASVVGIIVYRLSVFLAFSSKLSQHVNGTEALRKYLTPQTATSVTASLISFVVIMILNMVYEKVAILITDFGTLLLYLRWKHGVK